MYNLILILILSKSEVGCSSTELQVIMCKESQQILSHLKAKKKRDNPNLGLTLWGILESLINHHITGGLKLNGLHFQANRLTQDL